MATTGTKEAKTGKPASKTVFNGTLYRGTEGMWSWVLHRISGVGLYFFLLVHILDTAMIRVSPEAYNAVIGTYKNPIMGFGELVLVGAVVLHAFNGIRIILIDFTAWGAKYHRITFRIVLALFIVTMIAFAWRHIPNVIAEMTSGSEH